MKADYEQIDQLLANIELEKHKAKYPESVHNERIPSNGDCFYSNKFNRVLVYMNGKWEVQNE